ncbi:hypothetical protein [Kitasatospora purpeofusca]|uniref:hypothetical protein n=1 Tax=Kitasatospora purpeofusca TaxID=67352 RepID=UPI0036A0C5E9
MPRPAQPRPVLVGVAGLLVLAAATACTPLGTSAGARSTVAAPSASADTSAQSAGSLAVGPGPQATYTVAVQPPPGSCRYRYANGQPLPDPACTPGAVSPAVTQANLDSTICRKGGYTASVRPPVAVTDAEKRASAAAYGYAGSLHDAEYDHLVPLSAGGDPNDPRNLWLEAPSPDHRPQDGFANPKDDVEDRIHEAICSRRVPLAEAQRAVAENWATALAALGLAE